MHVLDKVEDAVGVAGLVIVPRHDLDEVGRERDAGLGVEDGGEAVGDEVARDDLLVGVAQDACVYSGGGVEGVCV